MNNKYFVERFQLTYPKVFSLFTSRIITFLHISLAYDMIQSNRCVLSYQHLAYFVFISYHLFNSQRIYGIDRLCLLSTLYLDEMCVVAGIDLRRRSNKN